MSMFQKIELQIFIKVMDLLSFAVKKMQIM